MEPMIAPNDNPYTTQLLENNHILMTPSIQQDMDVLDPEQQVNISEIIKDWNLNTNQARAFKIVAQHSFDQCPPQLRMYLGGAAGTGKSRVINAFKDFFV